MKNKIKNFTLEELEELAKGKRIFAFNPNLKIHEANVRSLIGKKCPSIIDACITESWIIICPERKSYAKTILGFFPPDSDCAGDWYISKIGWGVETLVKIGDPHKNKVTPIGILNFRDEELYVILKVSEEIYLLWRVWSCNEECVQLYPINPITE